MLTSFARVPKKASHNIFFFPTTFTHVIAYLSKLHRRATDLHSPPPHTERGNWKPCRRTRDLKGGGTNIAGGLCHNVHCAQSIRFPPFLILRCPPPLPSLVLLVNPHLTQKQTTSRGFAYTNQFPLSQSKESRTWGK